ncbi:MAG TPA: 50S ribosomal protein L18 [Elusimicrobia bacterium]|jgi:large subunit ribosomal protein L18|nr:50S ribosomal protein L18 [Elusimicrobiota bacterium]
MRPKEIRYFIRKKRIRKKIHGTFKRPRLSVYRSLKYIYAQIIDDNLGKTLVGVSSLSKELKRELNSGGKIGVAGLVGELVAKKALEKGIKEVVFDRGGRPYHGRIKSLAEGARKGGLEF